MTLRSQLCRVLKGTVIKKNYYIYICAFIFCLGGTILGFSLIFRLADRFAFNPGQIGTYLALGQFCYFIGCNLYHRFGSSANPAKMFSAASVIVFLSSLVLTLARLKALVYFSFWVQQLATGFFWPPLIAWLTSGLSGKNLNREITRYSRSWMSAALIGPPIAGFLYRWNVVANYLILNLCYFSVIIILFIMWRKTEMKDSTATISTETESSSVQKAAEKKLDIFRYRGWVCNFSSAMCLGVLINIIPIHIRDGLGFTEGSAGVILFFRCVAGLAGFSFLARFTTWHFKRYWFIVLQGGMAVSSLVYLFSGSRLAVFFLIASLFGLFNSACNTTSVFYSSTTGSNFKKNIASHEIFTALGQSLGTAGGGFLYQHFRFTGMCLSLFLALALGIAFSLYIERRRRLATASSTSQGAA